jgi:acyl-CoA synthetase (AMP-forming)/AMP-acid ligase II
MMNDTLSETTARKPLNIAEHLKRSALDRPFARAVVYPAARNRTGRIAYTHLTFQQLDRESDKVAYGLERIGITRGTRTVLMVRPGIDFFVLTFSLFKVGAIPVMVDPGMGIRRMIRCLEESRPTGFIGIPLAHVMRLLFPKYFRSVRHTVSVGPRLFRSGASLNQLCKGPWKSYPLAPTHANDTAAILFTTGSTGPAKGVVYTHGVFDAQIRQIRDRLDISPGEIDLPTFPLFALFDPALGMTAVIPDMDPTRPGFVNPERILEAIENHGVSCMFASPALLNRVGGYGRKHGIKLPSLKRVVSAGAPVSPDNIEQFSSMLDQDIEIFTPYGATESFPLTLIGSREILDETRSLSEQGYGNCVGKPLDDIRVEIIRLTDAPIPQWDDGLVLPDGEIGEIVSRGDLVTKDYFRNPRADELSKIAHGDHFWHRMGDLGWRDKKGRIWFCGRKNHRVVTREGVLFSVPCEAVFNEHPHVRRSALVGIGPRGNQIPVVCIEPESAKQKPARKVFLEELREIAASNEHTGQIERFLFHKRFPVDIRHNSKIFREQLARWAGQKLGGASLK